MNSSISYSFNPLCSDGGVGGGGNSRRGVSILSTISGGSASVLSGEDGASRKSSADSTDSNDDPVKMGTQQRISTNAKQRNEMAQPAEPERVSLEVKL